MSGARTTQVCSVLESALPHPKPTRLGKTWNCETQNCAAQNPPVNFLVYNRVWCNKNAHSSHLVSSRHLRACTVISLVSLGETNAFRSDSRLLAANAIRESCRGAARSVFVDFHMSERSVHFLIFLLLLLPLVTVPPSRGHRLLFACARG